MNLKKLPYEITENIKIYMWGNKDIYKKKLDIVHNLPKYKHHNLKVTDYCLIRNVYTEIEDELYCPKCGEKTLFPFTREVCFDCNDLINF